MVKRPPDKLKSFYFTFWYVVKKEKLESEILNILKNTPDLETNQIGNQLADMGFVMSYDRLSWHLKRMTDEEKLEREGKGRPWNYYYRLKQKLNLLDDYV